MEPVHEVINLPEFGQRAVSIHVDSKPFESCEVYSRKTSTATFPLRDPSSRAIRALGALGKAEMKS